MGLEEFYQKVTFEEKDIYSRIAQEVEMWGYKPQRAKSQAVNYVFVNRKTKKHLLKFSIEKGKPVLKLKFYAASSYSELFRESVRRAIEEYDFRYTGCYGCGKCGDALEGYVYTYEDGRQYFRCGGELISLPPITHLEVKEIMDLLKCQHEFYIKKN